MGKALKENRKFIGVDVLDVLGGIMERHTEHYKSDFELDRKILHDAAGAEDRADRIFYWLCRKCGTWCLLERNAFIRETREFHTVSYYAEQESHGVLLFAVEVTGIREDGSVTGDIYSLDLASHYQELASKAVHAGSVVLCYEDGEREEEPHAYIDGCADAELGKFISFEFKPESPKRHRELLWNERYRRDHFRDGDMEKYLAELESSRKKAFG